MTLDSSKRTQVLLKTEHPWRPVMKKQKNQLLRVAILVYLFTVFLWLSTTDALENSVPLISPSSMAEIP